MTATELLNKPITETGLSVKTVTIFKEMGYLTINSIILDETPIYEELHNRLMRAAILHFKNNEEELCEVQRAYNELLEYIKYYGVKFKSTPKHDKIEPIKYEEYEKVKETISKKILQYIGANAEEIISNYDKVIRYTEQIIDLDRPKIKGLDGIETFVIRFVCGIYTRGKEQTFEQTEQYLNEKGYKLKENIGTIFYNALHEIIKQIKPKRDNKQHFEVGRDYH